MIFSSDSLDSSDRSRRNQIVHRDHSVQPSVT